MLTLIQQIKKIVYIQTILPIVTYNSNKSGAIGVQHFSTPLPLLPVRTFLHTRTQIN